MPATRCFAHHEPGAAICSDCGTPVCERCRGEAGGAARCRDCVRRRIDVAELDAGAAAARIELRRSGVRVRRHRGDPVVLRRGGPAVAVLVLVLTGAAAIVSGILMAAIAETASVSVPILAVGGAVVLGPLVRYIFGGASTAVGIVYVLVLAVAVTLAGGLAVLGHGSAGALQVGTRTLAAPSALQIAAQGACYFAAAAVGFRCAAGRPPR